MSRSLSIHDVHIQHVKLSLKRNGFHSQRALAESVGYSLSTVSNFLRGKPVDLATFSELCEQLQLDWQTISGLEKLDQEDGAATLPDSSLHSKGATQTHDWGEAIDVSHFYNRVTELETLQTWIQRDRCRIITLLGMGGVGKTSLSIKLAQGLQQQFDSVIFRSLRNAPAPEDLFHNLISVLSHQLEIEGNKALPLLLTRLHGALREKRCLLILDNVESILEDCDRAGNYRSGYELYGEFLRLVGETTHQSCILLTSRQQPAGLQRFVGKTMPARCLHVQGLHTEAGRRIFDAFGTFKGNDKEWDYLIKRYAGNPLALRIIASHVKDCFNGDVSSFLKFAASTPIIFDDIYQLLDQQVQRLSPLEFEIMIGLANILKPTSVSRLKLDIVRVSSQGEVLQALTALKNRSMVEQVGTLYRLQPVLQNYILAKVIRAQD